MPIDDLKRREFITHPAARPMAALAMVDVGTLFLCTALWPARARIFTVLR